MVVLRKNTKQYGFVDKVDGGQWYELLLLLRFYKYCGVRLPINALLITFETRGTLKVCNN
jgi:hypothetical protein